MAEWKLLAVQGSSNGGQPVQIMSYDIDMPVRARLHFRNGPVGALAAYVALASATTQADAHRVFHDDVLDFVLDGSGALWAIPMAHDTKFWVRSA